MVLFLCAPLQSPHGGVCRVWYCCGRQAVVLLLCALLQFPAAVLLTCVRLQFLPVLYCMLNAIAVTSTWYQCLFVCCGAARALVTGVKLATEEPAFQMVLLRKIQTSHFCQLYFQGAPLDSRGTMGPLDPGMGPCGLKLTLADQGMGPPKYVNC